MLWKSFWLHEDDFNAAQFLPLSCWEFCRQQLERLQRHEAAARSPEGVGWSSMYRVPAAPASIADLAISTRDVAAAMPWRLRRAGRVRTGTFAEEGVRLPRMAAYMAGRSAIVFGWNAGDIVESLWFHNAHEAGRRRGAIQEAFFRIGALRSMLLVDWGGVLVDLSDREAIRRYLGGEVWTGGAAGEPPATPESTETGSCEETPDAAPSPPLRPDSLHRFPSPVYPGLVTRKTAAGPVQAILENQDAQGWAIALYAASLREAAAVTPVPIPVDADAPIGEWRDLAGARVMASRVQGRRERLAVWDIQTGAAIVDGLDAEMAVVCPDGDRVLLFQDRGVAVMDLSRPDKPARQTGLFPMGARDGDGDRKRLDAVLDNPGSAMTVSAADAECFTLAIGDYGFAVVAEAKLGAADETPLVITKPARAIADGLVYDPVEIVDVVPNERLVVLHGGGSGLARFDLRNGEREDCPLPEGNPEPRYAAFRRAVPSLRSPGLWVETDVGPCFWNADGSLERLSEKTGSLLATDGDRFLAVSTDGWDLIRGRLSAVPEA